MADQNHECLFETAWDYICRGVTTDAERAQGEDGEFVRQTRLLRQWASQSGCLISSQRLKQFSLISDSTSEHIIYFDPVEERAIKQTLPGQFGWVPRLDADRWTLGIAKPLDYLNRWRLFNLAFGDDVRLEGVTAGSSLGVGNVLTEPVSAVISQRWHRAADTNSPTPSAAEVSVFLRRLDFAPLPNSFHGWQRRSDGVVLLDTRPDNFIKTNEGIAPIDLLVTHIEPNSLMES